jgi:hypothetical protein
MTRACSTAADVVGVGVAHGVPADQWQCLGGSPWRREAFGAGSQGKGQRRRLGDDVAGRVCGARRARSGARVHAWARLGFTFLVHVVHHLVEARVQDDQGSVVHTNDKVGHARVDQREGEHKHVHAMTRHGMSWSKW